MSKTTLALHEFVKLARKEKSLPLMDLAAKTGCSYGLLYKLEEGSSKKPPHPSTLKKLSSALSLDYELLMDMAGYLPDSTQQTSQTELFKVPVVSWEFALKHTPVTRSLPSGVSEEYIVSQKPNSQAFAVRIDSGQWHPTFFKRDIVVIHPHQPIKNNDILLCKVKDRLTFKRYQTDGKSTLLVTLTPNEDGPQYTEFHDFEQNAVLGFVVEQLRTY